MCKGSTADSDSVCLGSNPSSAAKKSAPVFPGLDFVLRGVAQFGGALRSGRRGRRFKSCHLDHTCGEQFARRRFFLFFDFALALIVGIFFVSINPTNIPGNLVFIRVPGDFYF